MALILHASCIRNRQLLRLLQEDILCILLVLVGSEGIEALRGALLVHILLAKHLIILVDA